MPLYGAGNYLSLAGGTVTGTTTFSQTLTLSNDLNLAGGSAITFNGNSIVKTGGNGALRWTLNNGSIPTVAGLPAASSALDGARSFVSDATVTTFASSVVGGGANHVPVYCDGSGTPAWKIGQMAAFTFTIGALTKTFTVSAGDTTRVVNALTADYGPGLTNAQIFDIWANLQMRALKDTVKRVEGDAAAVSARAAVVDVVAT